MCKNNTTSRPWVGPLKDGDRLVTDETEQAELLNKEFASVFTDEDTSDVRCRNMSGMNHCLV